MAVASLVPALLAMPLAGPASAAVPSFDRTLAGPALAELYASGGEYDDALGRVVLADTGLDRILVYEWDGTAPDGARINAWGIHGTADGQFDSPRDIAIGPDSAIFVADAGNNRIQKFDPNGNWKWTRGGLGSCNECLNTPIGLTWDAANGVLLVASTGQDRVKAFAADGTFLWQSPTGATLGISKPRDASRGPDGRIWISDYMHHQVKAYDVSPNGQTWTTTPSVVLGQAGGGAGTGQLKFPYNVDFSPDGRTAYVSDTANSRVARWQASSSAWTGTPTWQTPFGTKCADPCPNPPADAGLIEHLRRVMVTAGGVVIHVDTWGNGMQFWSPAGSVIDEVGGARAPLPGFAEAAGVGLAGNGTTYVVDSMNQRIERFSATGSFLNSGGYRGSSTGKLSWPQGVAAAPDGHIWIADTQNDRLQRWNADLSGPVVVGSLGTTVGKFSYPRGVDVDDGGIVWVADTNNERIQRYDPSTASFAVFGTQGSGPGQFLDPAGIAVSSTAVFVADTGNDRIQKLDRSGNFIAQLGGFSGPEGITLAPDGTLWVADTLNDRIVHLSASLQDLGDTFGSFGSGQMQFFEPHSLAASASELFVADSHNNRVQVFDLTTSSGDTTPPDGTLTSPKQDQVFTSTPVPMNGTATDDVAVGSVTVAIKDRTTSLWYRSDGTWGAVQEQPATLSNPGGTSTNWTYSWTPAAGGSGSYSVRVTAKDTSNNVDATKPTRRFTVQGGGGGGLTVTYDRQISDAGGVAPLYPAGGATDSAGTRFVADSGGSRIVKITSGGTQSVVSSTGWNDPRDIEFDGGDPTASSLWVADTSDSQIVKIDKTGAVLATFGGSGTLKTPYGLSNDGTGVYVADTYNNRVVELAKSNGAVAWSRTACGGITFARPRDAAVGSDGHVYVADTDNNRIVELDPADGTCLGSFGSVGSGNGQFRSPRALTSDGAGGLWVAEGGNNRLQHVTNAGAFLSKIGSFGEANGQFRSAHCVFLDGSLVDVCDTFNYRIQRFSASGTPETLTYDSTVGGTQPANGGFNGAFDAAYAPSGQLYGVDWFNHRLQRFSGAGAFELEFGGYGSPSGSMIFPRGVLVKSNGDLVVTNSEDNRIDLFTAGGSFISSTKPSGSALLRPHQTALATNGDYWIADTGNNRVIRITTGGTVADTITGITAPHGVAVDGSGNVYVSSGNTVRKYDANGANPVTLLGAGGGNGQVMSPFGLRIAPVGGSTRLLVADAGNDRVQVVSLAGAFVAAFGAGGSGAGQFDSPRGISVSPSTGEIAVADFTNNRISIWTVS